MNDLRAVIDCPADRWRMCQFCGATYLFMGIKSVRNSLRDPILCRPDVRCLWRTSGRYWEAGDNGECEKVYRDCLRASWLWRADLYTICGKWWKNCGACVQLWFKMASVARMLRLIPILLARLAYLKFALSGKKRKWQIEAAKFFTLLLFSYLHINKWNIL